jgi:multicomponent Na+:H+ antiporter subunit G
MIEILASVLIISGLMFFIAGSIGLLRLPDLYSRLHAITKADNLGLGLLLLGIMLLAGDWIMAAKLFLVWLLVIFAGSVSANLIAEYTRRKERQP